VRLCKASSETDGAVTSRLYWPAGKFRRCEGQEQRTCLSEYLTDLGLAESLVLGWNARMGLFVIEKGGCVSQRQAKWLDSDGESGNRMEIGMRWVECRTGM